MLQRLMLLGLAAALVGCGQKEDAQPTKAPVPPKKKVGYCFFKDTETKDWAASRDKDGNIVVRGRAYRSDSRYRAVLNAATVTGTIAEITPSITVNDTGYGAEDNWWDVKTTIPNSSAIDEVRVICGPRTLADLKVAPKQ